MATRHNADTATPQGPERNTFDGVVDLFDNVLNAIVDVFRPHPTQSDYMLWPPARYADVTAARSAPGGQEMPPRDSPGPGPSGTARVRLSSGPGPIPPRPNTVAFSAGAVCCPDEASARRHTDRATWWDADAAPESGYVGPVWDPLSESVVAQYRWAYGPRRRWTR